MAHCGGGLRFMIAYHTQKAHFNGAQVVGKKYIEGFKLCWGVGWRGKDRRKYPVPGFEKNEEERLRQSGIRV